MNKKGFSWLWIVLPLLLILIVVLGVMVYNLQKPKEDSKTTNTGSQQTPGTTQSSTVKDCGTDMGCFVNAAGSCQKSKILSTQTINLFGIEQTTSSYLELKGVQSGKCLFYIKTRSNNLKFSNELIQQMQSGGASQEEINQQEREAQTQAKSLEGRDGTCSAETQKIVTMLTNWQQGSFSTEDFEGMDCSGAYFSQSP